MKDALAKHGLNTTNSVVIGSGILQALGIRNSKDIDVVTTEKMFDSLRNTGYFDEILNHDQVILTGNKIEIGTGWLVLGNLYKFEDFDKLSVIIGGVRYVTLDFLYRVKKSWLNDEEVKEKALGDVTLIENYLKSSK